MLFFKTKQHGEGLLPPPAPFPDMEFSDIGLDQHIKKPALVDTTIVDTAIVDNVIKKSIFDAPDVKEFGDLMKDLDKEAEQKNPISKKEKSPKKAKALAVKMESAVKEETKKQKNPKSQEPEIEELKSELPEELEGFDISFEKELDFGYLGEELGFTDKMPTNKLEHQTKKPKEIFEAEEEIKSAIEKIKKREKTPFLGRLFGKKENRDIPQESWNLDKPRLEQPKEENLIPQPAKADSLSAVQDKINKARTALTNFDLRTAKANYIEIMKIYNNMNPKEQARVFHDIRELYFERKSAEGLKV